jgi:hypothetical protein
MSLQILCDDKYLSQVHANQNQIPEPNPPPPVRGNVQRARTPARRTAVEEDDEHFGFQFEYDPQDMEWEDPEELNAGELRRLQEERSRGRSRTPQVDARDNSNGSDVRKQLEDAGIRKIQYNILKPGNLWDYNFEIPVGLSFTSFRSTLLTEYGVEQALHAAAVFQFSLNTASNKWCIVKDEATWVENILKTIYTNFEEREEERIGIARGRKKKTKDALPLTVKIVSPLIASSEMLYSECVL